MWIFDGHLDLAFNGVNWNRDLRLDVHELRKQESLLAMSELGRGSGTVTLPELRKADVRVAVATVFARQEKLINHPFGWTTPEACYASAMSHLAYYRAMEHSGWLRLIRTRGELASHVSAAEADSYAPLGCLLSMECADAVLDPENLREWRGLGLCSIGITHYGENRYGGGTSSERGLSPDALPLLRLIEELGMALDLTHLSDRSFNEVASNFGGRVLASHQNCREFCNWQRQFSDQQIQFVVERDGVIGVAFDAMMLQPGWVYGVTKPEVSLKRVVDNIDHICQLAGDSKHVAIGSDLDGGYGSEQTPADLNTIADLQKIPELLLQRRYGEADIQRIMNRNWERLYVAILPQSRFGNLSSIE